MELILLALIIYLIGVPVAWWSEYMWHHALLDTFDISTVATVSGDSCWERSCVRKANEACLLSWITVILNSIDYEWMD
jgi:hypothetical protein